MSRVRRTIIRFARDPTSALAECSDETNETNLRSQRTLVVSSTNLKSLKRTTSYCCRFVDGDVFAGLGRTQYLSLADNEVPSIPRHILSHLSLLRTLDLSRNRISRIDSDDFKVCTRTYKYHFIPITLFICILASKYVLYRDTCSRIEAFTFVTHFIVCTNNLSRKY